MSKRFSVEEHYLEHESGTKDYHILIVRNKETDTGFVVRRWGKCGAKGQASVATYDKKTVRKALQDVDALIGSKTSPTKRYCHHDKGIVGYNDAGEVSEHRLAVNDCTLSDYITADYFYALEGAELIIKPIPKLESAVKRETPSPSLPSNYGGW